MIVLALSCFFARLEINLSRKKKEGIYEKERKKKSTMIRKKRIGK